MKLGIKLAVIAAVLAMAVGASATPFTITSVTYTESYPAVVTWDSTHIYVNWQGLPFTTSDYVNLFVNGYHGMVGALGTVEYDFPCQGCLYGNDGGPYAFTVPSTVYTEGDPGYPFVQNTFYSNGIDIGYIWSSGWTGAAFNGEVFTFTGTSTPEPGTLVLLGSGVLGLAGMLRRKINL